MSSPQGNSEAYFFCGSGFPSFYRASPLAEYTVDYLPYTHPGGERLHAGFEPGFVPYSSCDAPNYGFANTPLHPLCNCQVSACVLVTTLPPYATHKNI